ncbi:uncharacterized protein LOC114169584 [Vigna unguiculata]|uniref:uncharacterized protein LOC114169584 n=1 Tax=Vigna unguiculata TaxID=3917 RepID=UPI0010162CED|nr:uncharacterized protein LOC114169584 [Vigna unguiculata]XP_027910611.1 uncharacterized protein LOC114169584 [Vigna unguiculata]
MDLRFNSNKWVGNIYQKFEAVCHEVDDIVGQDAKKYLENQVQNVGDSVKKFYSGVVHELLPLDSLASSKYEDHLLVAETNNIDFSVDSVCKDNNKERDEENPINHYYVAFMNSNATDIADHKQHGVPVKNIHESGSVSLGLEGSCITKEEVGVDSRGTSESKKENFHISFEEVAIGSADYNQDGVPVKNIPAYQESDESCSASLELEDSYITQEEVGVDSRGTSESERENFHTCFEEFAVESDPKPMNLMSLGEKESLEFSMHSESSSFDSGWEVSIKTKVNIYMNAEKNSCLIADENAMNSSSSKVWSPQSLDEETPINYFCLALRDTNAMDIADIQKVGVHTRNVNQVSDESCTVSLEVEDSYISQEEVGDDSRGTSVSTKENIHTSSEVVALESVPKPLNMMSVGEKGPLEFPIHSEPCFDSFESGYKVSIRTKDNRDVNPRQNSCLIVEKNARNSSTSQLLSSQSLDEKESTNVSLLRESSNAYQNTHGILAEVSPDVSVSSERPMTRTEPSCSSSSYENESCKRNPGDASLCATSDSFVLPVCCESSTHPAREVMEPQGGLVFSGFCQSMGSKDKSLVCSLESCTEVIQLNDDPKVDKNCVNVDDSELHAVACRTRKLRSYKKRIQDAFASKKRLSKEYEQLAIWYGDCDIEPRRDFLETLLPLSIRTDVESKNVQEQHDSESEWELL